jgi:hypothetical protein
MTTAAAAVARCRHVAAAAMLALAALAGCASASDATFACGGVLRCDRATQYCETLKTDTPALPNDYACRPLPAACQASKEPAQQACGCFPAHTRGDFCSAADSSAGRAFYRTQVGGH